MSSTVTVGFDDIDTSDSGYAQIANGYSGLDWTNFYVADTSSSTFANVFPGSGYDTGNTSGTQIAYNYGANPVSVSSSSGIFTLKSLELTAGWDTKLSVEITAYKDGTEVYDKIVKLGDAGPKDLHLNIKGVDEILFTPLAGGKHDPNLSYSGNAIVFDDMVFGKITGASSTDLRSAIGLASAFGADHHAMPGVGASAFHGDFQHRGMQIA